MFKLDFIGLILIISYIVIALVFYYYVLKRERLLTIPTTVSSFLAFAFPLGIFILNQLFNFISIPPDTEVYASIIQDYGKNYNNYSFGVTGYSILNLIQFHLCFERPPVFIVFNILYYQIAVLYIFKAFKIYCFGCNRIIDHKVFVILQFLSIIYPVAILQTSSILREPMLLMFFSINIYLLVKSYYLGFKSYYLVIFFWLFLFLIRPLTGISMLVVFFICYIDVKKLLTFKNTVKFIVFSILLFFVVKQIILSLYSIDFSVEWIAGYRESSTSRFGVEGYEKLNWDSPIFYAKNLFLLFFQYLLSPLPFLVSNEITINKLIPLIDSLFIIIMILAIMIYKKRFLNKWLIVLLVFIIIPAIVETNISGAYRHRMNGVIMLIPIASYIFSIMKIKRFQYK